MSSSDFLSNFFCVAVIMNITLMNITSSKFCVFKCRIYVYMKIHFFPKIENSKIFSQIAPTDGKVLPKGSNVVISPFIIGRNARIWENPKSFIPERFELENLTNLNPFSYLPFSAGPRNCIGQKFAMLEMKCTIVKVLQKFEISLEPGFKLVIMPEIVLKPAKGIKLRLKAR